MKLLTEDQCREAIKNGEFDSGLIADPAALVILTQSWCPQWHAVRDFSPEAEKKLVEFFGREIPVYYIEYDVADWKNLAREDFMTFKETAYNNREIPYLRYYINGKFVQDSNYTNLQGVLSRLGVK